jgi:hypothetical protein
MDRRGSSRLHDTCRLVRYPPIHIKSERKPRSVGAARAHPTRTPPRAWGIRAPTERGSEIPRGTLGWGCRRYARGRLRGYAVHRHAASKGFAVTFRQPSAGNVRASGHSAHPSSQQMHVDAARPNAELAHKLPPKKSQWPKEKPRPPGLLLGRPGRGYVTQKSYPAICAFITAPL